MAEAERPNFSNNGPNRGTIVWEEQRIMNSMMSFKCFQKGRCRRNSCSSGNQNEECVSDELLIEDRKEFQGPKTLDFIMMNDNFERIQWRFKIGQ